MKPPKKIKVTFWLRPDTLKTIKTIASVTDDSQGKVVDLAIRSAAQLFDIEPTAKRADSVAK